MQMILARGRPSGVGDGNITPSQEVHPLFILPPRWSVAAVSDLMGDKRRALVLSVDNLIQVSKVVSE